MVIQHFPKKFFRAFAVCGIIIGNDKVCGNRIDRGSENMKICLVCGHDNSDEMGFCLQCGSPLASQENTAWQPNGPETVSYEETPTVVRRMVPDTQSFGQQFVPPPGGGSGKKLIAIGGGLAVLLLLVIAGVGAIVGYNYFSRSKSNTNENASIKTNGNRSTPANSNSNSNSTPNTSPTPAVSFTPPIQPTKSGSFTVYANKGWQLSDIDTVALEEFRTKIDGKVDLNGIKAGVSAGGVNDAASKSRRVYAEFPTGALLMRTRYADGNFSNVAAVAAGKANGSWRNYPYEIGRLEFCVNDNAPEQNGGQFTVTATLTLVPKSKK
jgi:hypothetical protein